jgi:hypothetical protein
MNLFDHAWAWIDTVVGMWKCEKNARMFGSKSTSKGEGAAESGQILQNPRSSS